MGRTFEKVLKSGKYVFGNRFMHGCFVEMIGARLWVHKIEALLMQF